MDITELTDEPELTITVGDKEYSFGEIDLNSISGLQAWLNKRIKHPFETLKAQIVGLPDAAVVALTRDAREEAKHWPPQVGTGRGNMVLSSTEDGQIEALRVGLQKFHAGTTTEQARDLYKRLERGAIIAKRRGDVEDITRVYSVMFGYGDPLLADEGKKA